MKRTESTSFQSHLFKRICKSIGIVIVTVILSVFGKLIIRQIPSLYATFLEMTGLADGGIGEIYQILNTLVFLVVGGGIALATSNYQRLGFIFGIVLVIFLGVSIYLFNPALDYHQFVEKMSVEQKLPYKDAKIMMDSFLNSEVDHSGFLGYYIYTATSWEWIKRLFYFALSIFWVLVSFVGIREDEKIYKRKT